MKKISRVLGVSSVLALAMSLSLISLAFAADLNWTSDQDVSLSSDTITILTGSVATTLTVNADNIVVEIPASSTFKVKSTDKTIGYQHLGAGTATTTCTSGVYELDLTTSSGSAETVTIFAGTSQCTNGGGGGGGGGGVVPTSSPSPSPTSTPNPIQTTAHPDGTLVIDGSTVSLIWNGGRVGYRNQAEYLSYGYNFSQVVTANTADKALTQTTVAKAMAGTLVLDAADGKTVYMIGLNAAKRGFTSAAVFKALGYSFGNLPKINLSDYPTGDPIGDATQPHPDGALVKDGATVWWITGGQKHGFETMTVFNTYGFNFSRVVPANAADLALAEGSVVKLRDGTLVNDGGSYYIISDGNKRMFSSLSGLTGWGYKASNVVSTSLVAYPVGSSL